MCQVKIEICRSLPAKDELNPILLKYYELVVARMDAIGFAVDPAAPRTALAEFWENSDAYLAPKGCLVLARNGAAQVVGCGMMKRLSADTGELKRVFVTEEARGTGLGRALIETRINVARQMGLKRLIADTLTTNVEMRGLYPKLGFKESKEPIETTTFKDQPMLRPHLHFFTMDI